MLFGLSASNYILMYLANIYLARHLTLEAFDDYSVAVSMVTLLSALATLGLEKYALRIIALYIERENWSRLKGFWFFSIRAILLFCFLLLGMLAIGLDTILAWHQADFHIAIAIYACFLPVIAICLFLIEVITVFGSQVLALSLYRFFLPAIYLILITSLNDFSIEPSAVSAVLCFGTAWCLTLNLMLVTARAASPRPLRHSSRDSRGRLHWLRRSLPLLISSLMMTLLTSSGVIVLELLYPSEAAVATFAVAMQTSGFISLIGTSTNRYYLPMLVVLLERRDHNGIYRLLNKRMRLIAAFITLFLLIIAQWGGEILALFGEDFSQGSQALFICAGGACFSTLFADSPYYLQFMGRNRLVVGLMSLSAATMLGLSFVLGSRYGAIGVAIAYALPTLLLFSSLKWLASRHMRALLAVSARS